MTIEDAAAPTAPPPGARWRLIGPGLVAAATGVGAGDLIATLVAGSKFGYALLWAAVVGTLLKISLAEAVGRWSLASGRTIFEGWSSLGPGWFGGRLNWASVYFGVYVVVWGFVYGATAMTASALPVAALLDRTPLALDLKVWAMILGVVGVILVWFNRYPLFEKLMTGLVAVMFVTVVGLAVLVAPDLPALVRGLIPTLPAGSAFYTLGLIGGVGGTITLAAYGYWIGQKGWRGRRGCGSCGWTTGSATPSPACSSSPCSSSAPSFCTPRTSPSPAATAACSTSTASCASASATSSA